MENYKNKDKKLHYWRQGWDDGFNASRSGEKSKTQAVLGNPKEIENNKSYNKGYLEGYEKGKNFIVKPKERFRTKVPCKHEEKHGYPF